jgi:hypothetical protein
MDELHRQLIDRLHKNLNDYHKQLLRFEPWALIDMAGRIAHTGEVHDYLTTRYEFQESEAEYLLRFENPLEMVTDAWEIQREDIADMDFIMHTLCDRQDALSDYPLSTATDEVPPDAAQKPSILVKLREAANRENPRQTERDGHKKDDGAR